MPRRGAAVRIAGALAAIVLALVVVEGALRVVHALAPRPPLPPDVALARREGLWMLSDDAELRYVHRPHARYQGAVAESHGVLRAQEVAAQKPAGADRVAIVGDSVGASVYLYERQRFAGLLEERLRGSARPVEVLNFCVNGYDTLQEARLLETAVTPLAPDAVVLVYCLNDPFVSEHPLSALRDPEPPALHLAALVRPGLAAVTGHAFDRLVMLQAGPDIPEAMPHWRAAHDPGGPGWRCVLAGFDRIAAWSRAKDVPVVVVIVPLLLPLDPAGATTAPFRAQVAAAAEERGLPALDLQDAFARRELAAVADVVGDVYHLGAGGHAVVADEVLPAVRALLAGQSVPRTAPLR